MEDAADELKRMEELAMPERNWKRSKERVRFRRKCSGQFNKERIQRLSASRQGVSLGKFLYPEMENYDKIARDFLRKFSVVSIYAKRMKANSIRRIFVYDKSIVLRQQPEHTWKNDRTRSLAEEGKKDRVEIFMEMKLSV